MLETLACLKTSDLAEDGFPKMVMLQVILRFGQAETRYRQLKKEKKAEEEEAFNNNKEVRSLYGTAHCLKMEVMKQINDLSMHKCFFQRWCRQGGVKEVMETQEGKKEVEQVNIIRLCC